MRVVFAGGGTGGHVFPGVAVAQAVHRLRPDAEIVFLGTPRPIDREVVPANGYALVEQSVRPIPTRPWHVPGFLWHWFKSKRLAARVLTGATPSGGAGATTAGNGRTVVLGLGGYAAGPAIRVAAARGVPAAILNPDLIPGKANVWATKYVREVYCQWIDSRGRFGRTDNIYETGCPIRADIGRGDRAAAAAEFALDAGKRTLVVTGASQGARTINDALLELAPQLDRSAKAWQVLHLTGRKDFDAFTAALGARRIAWRPVPFTQRMDLVYALADLVIGRAGAGSLAEITAVGVPSILMPYPFHADRHQHHNAETLVRAGAAILVEDRIDVKQNAAALAPALLPLINEPERLTAYRDAARRIGKPDAADTVARRLIALAESN
jgi:UDP-N-acetylglucosamine--N-acetylmuramyl-(pentapeptide) pyrophosphoryl-undecaprenol N-acetylglucosamine transferase